MALLKARGHTEESDSYFAAKLRAAGFVFVGKTNLPELAASPDRARRLRRDPQPMGAGSLDGRVERRFGSCRRRGSRPRRACERHGRIDSRAGERLRLGGVEADAAAHLARTVVRRVLGDAHPRARRDAISVAIAPPSSIALPERCPATVHGAASRATVRGGGRRGPRSAASRLAYRPALRARREPRLWPTPSASRQSKPPLRCSNRSVTGSKARVRPRARPVAGRRAHDLRGCRRARPRPME